MIKARFGGLFSSLNRRDIQILTDFEIFLGTAQDNLFSEIADSNFFDPQSSPIVPDGEEFEVEAPGEFVTESLGGIYNYFKELYDELHWQCQNTYFTDQELLIAVKQHCRIQLTRVAPVLRKLKKLVDRSRNESLD